MYTPPLATLKSLSGMARVQEVPLCVHAAAHGVHGVRGAVRSVLEAVRGVEEDLCDVSCRHSSLSRKLRR